MLQANINQTDSPVNVQQSKEVEWTYEMRRKAQSILPYLFLGPVESARDLALLHSNGITAICILRTQAEATYLKPKYPQSFAYQVFQISDSDEQNLIRILPLFRQFIETQAEKPNGRILVHDEGGMSRAPAMVILYLIEKYKASYEEVTSFVKSKRYCIHLNLGFIQQCKAFQDICQARETNSGYNSSLTALHRKRTLEEDEEEMTTSSTYPNQRLQLSATNVE